MEKYILRISVLLLCAISLMGCTKFLDAKPENTLAQPTTLKDLRAILDFEEEFSPVYQPATQLATDEFLITEKGLGRIPKIFQDMYLWKDNLDEPYSWQVPYKVISIANVVLEGLERISDGKSVQGNYLKGEALFLRGWMFFSLAQLYCKHYNFKDKGDGLGLVLRLDADSKISIGRSNVQQSYDQLLQDLTVAEGLLVDDSPYVTRPSKGVAQAALARVYLSMGNYEMAEKMADAYLAKHKPLLDYNTLKPKDAFPINLQNNTELRYYGRAWSSSSFMFSAETYVNPDLLKLYAPDDLRNTIFLEPSGLRKKFKGFYIGRKTDVTAVIATDEVYLIKAECAARRSNLEQGLLYLNQLRKHRFPATANYLLSASDADQLLRLVLRERRLQLVGRGLRWFDLRRLNADPAFAETLRRSMEENGKIVEYVLEPTDPRYVRLIPRLAIAAGGYTQNPR